MPSLIDIQKNRSTPGGWLQNRLGGQWLLAQRLTLKFEPDLELSFGG